MDLSQSAGGEHGRLIPVSRDASLGAVAAEGHSTLRLAAGSAAACALAAAAGGLIGWDPALGLGAVMGLAYVAVAAFSARLAFLIWIPSFFVPFYAFGNLWLKAGFALAGAAALGAALADRGGLKRLVQRYGAMLLAVAGFAAWLGLSAVWSGQPAQAISEWLNALLAVSVLVVTVLVVRDVHGARLALGAFVLAGAFSALLGLSGLSTAPANPDALASVEAAGRISAGTGDPNVLAAALVATVALALGMVPGSRGPARAALLGAALLSAAGVAATQSRGGLVAALAAICVGVFLYRREIGRVLPIVAIAVCGVAVYFAVAPSALERVTDYGDAGDGRSELWTVGWRAFGDHPVTGIGLNQFRIESSNYVLEPGSLKFVRLIAERPVVVHNTYLQFLVETGIVGLALYLLVVWRCLSRLAAATRRLAAGGVGHEVDMMRGLLVAIAAMLAAGVFLSTGIDYKIWLLFGLAAALGVVALEPRGESPAD
jgi:O-antigen ligase